MLLRTLSLFLRNVSKPSARPRRAHGKAGIECELLESRELLTAHAFAGASELHTRALTPSPALTQAVQKLTSDLQTIGVRANVPSSQLSAFQNDIQQVETSAKRRPNPRSLHVLQRDLATMSASGDFNGVVLQRDSNTVLSSAGVPRSLIFQLRNDGTPVLTAPGLTASDRLTLANDVGAVLTALGQRR